MSDEKKPARRIQSIQDKEGVVRALVVTTEPVGGQGGTVRVIYQRSLRFPMLLEQKNRDDELGVGVPE